MNALTCHQLHLAQALPQRCLVGRSQPQTRDRNRGSQCSATVTSDNLVSLGASDVKVSRLGIGTLQWGDPGSGYGQRYDEPELQRIFEAAVNSGVTFFDTAEVYGYQGSKTGASSEHILGRALKKQRLSPATSPLCIGSKCFTIPWTFFLGVGGGWRFGKDSLVAAAKASLQRLQLDSIPLYQIHFPFPTFSNETFAEALTQLHQEGLIKAVGVCNMGVSDMRALHSLLAKQGIPLASNQVKFNVLEQGPIKSGLLDACKELSVTLVAHSPLQQGLLTDKQLADDSKAGKVRPLLKLMALVGTLNGGHSVTQVALSYLMRKGAIPIPGCKSVQQLKDLAGALEWALDDNEVAMIDERLAAL